MGAFIESCEREFANLGDDAEVTKKALGLFERAKSAAPPDSVYVRRIALVDEFLSTLRNRATQIDVPRPAGLPEYRVIDMGKWPPTWARVIGPWSFACRLRPRTKTRSTR
jgi:hypothetical protein